MVSKRKVIRDEEAKIYFKKALAYIKKDSVKNAEKVKREILASTRALADEPQRQHAPDKYRKNNDGSCRAYELHKYRISYFVSSAEIRIVRIRHTGQEPKEY